ncbi:MAG: NAD(P)H-dependent oxidoreductase, partial [Candidatus Micrarchaeia archaeon]
MHQKKACIIYSYPQGSFHGEQMLATVKKTLEDDRTEHSLINLYEMNFNPVMSAQEVATYGKQIPLEITRQQEILRASDLWIFIYPVWWSTPPAILKGWIDRVLTPRFAYDMRGGQIAPLLMNKRALIIRTYSYSALHEQKTGNVAKNFMENCVLASCGVKSLAIDVFSINSLAESAFKHTLGYIPGAVRRMLVEYTVVPHHLRSIPA